MYCDTNWISDIKDFKSTIDYVFTIGGVAVSWKSRKQTCVVRSTTKSEFITLDKAGKEVECFRNFLEDIRYWPKLITAISIHCHSDRLLEGHKTICIMVNLDTYIVNTTPLTNWSRMVLLSLIMWNQRRTSGIRWRNAYWEIKYIEGNDI